jgi:hypothetical protein
MDPTDGTWPPYKGSSNSSSGTQTCFAERPLQRKTPSPTASPDLTARIEQLRVQNREIGEVRQHVVRETCMDPANRHELLVHFEGCSQVQRYDIRDPDAGSSIFAYTGETVIIDENGYLLPL